MKACSQAGTWARWLAIGAGAMDLGTGQGLVFAPALTLKLMSVPVPWVDALVFVRFVGVFVGSVGLSYLLALRGAGTLRAVFDLTRLFRAGAGTFCAVAVGLGWFAPMWLMVALTDWSLVVAQSWLLRQSWGENEDR